MPAARSAEHASCASCGCENALTTTRSAISPVFYHACRCPLEPAAYESADDTRDCAKDHHHEDLEWCLRHVVKGDERSQALRPTRPKSQHQVLPIESLRQRVEEQIHAKNDHHIENKEGDEGDDGA